MPDDPITDAGMTDAQRAASVTLRAEAERGEGGLDAANQSLRDALRISYRLLQLGIVILVALYILSGFQSIGESERGIRVLAGRIAEDDLRPGLHLSAPYPIGEIVRIETGAQSFNVDRGFWPQGAPDAGNLPRRNRLAPGVDGSIITGDGNLAHTRWAVSYTRADPGEFVKNIHRDDEQAIVRGIVRRAIIATVASVSIEELLKSSTEERGGSVAARARSAAQQMLDDIGAGIEIGRLTLSDRVPPGFTTEAFNTVQSSQAESEKAVQDARSNADLKLKEAAGLAHDELTTLISRYEQQLDDGDDEIAELTLAKIEGLLTGEPVEIDDEPVTDRVTGEASAMLTRADQKSSETANLWRQRLTIFDATLENYRTSPRFTLYNAWANAFETFMANENVQMLLHPPGTEVAELLINQDPEIIKEIENRERLKRNQEAAIQRDLQRKQQQFDTPTGRQYEQ